LILPKTHLPQQEKKMTSIYQNYVREYLAAPVIFQMAATIRTQFELAGASVEPQFEDRLKASLSLGSIADGLVDFVEGLYTEEEVQQLMDFYNSPVGKKSLAAIKTPIFQESMKSLAERIAPQLKDFMATEGQEMVTFA